MGKKAEISRPVYRRSKDGSGVLKICPDNSFIFVSTSESLFTRVEISHIKEGSICSERNNPERFKKQAKRILKSHYETQGNRFQN
jgi:hypothetical protein